jgi:hypothetical protein
MHQHRDRRATRRSAKIGPPLRGRPEKTAGHRRNACTGNHPARRITPRQRISPGDHDVQRGSNRGLGSGYAARATAPSANKRRASAPGIGLPKR